MLLISIPKGETTGKCRINGEGCEFKIEGGQFCYRRPGEGRAWDRRTIYGTTPNGPLTTYTCASANAAGDVVYREGPGGNITMTRGA